MPSPEHIYITVSSKEAEDIKKYAIRWSGPYGIKSKIKFLLVKLPVWVLRRTGHTSAVAALWWWAAG